MSFPRYSAYKDSGVEWLGAVPQHWSVYSLKRTVDGCVNGLWGDEPDGENDIAVIRVADFERSFSTVRLDKLTYRSIKPKERQSRLINSGDLLIEKSGGGEKTLVGCVVLFTHEFNAITSNFVARMRPLAEFDNQFLCYAFGNLYHGRVNYPSVKQVTGIQNLDAESYLQERFCFPARAEQTQIARFLDHQITRIDALIEEQQRLIKLLKEKRQTVISHSVTKGLNPTVPMKDTGVEWLSEVPAHWEVGGLTRFIGPVVDYRGRTPRKVDDGVFLVTARNIRNGRIDYEASEEYADPESAESLLARGRPEIGDLLFTMEAPLGQVALIDRTDIALAQRIVKFRGEPCVMRNHYLMFWLMSANCQARLETLATGSTALGIKSSKLGMIECLAPPLSEQDSIISHIQRESEKNDALVYEAENVIGLLQERRSALIAAALTGKIDVRGWLPPAFAKSSVLEQEAV
ncbi:restriction endonuclease subunit S [Pseudomonas edaphica]|uniref:Restriction endonuclease subunit S n=1 Tax=Pseudomonas edaphica TaxID=2006980 RepID=A0ABY2U2W8_9PSED|nr:restriction endonuclease subunit S [Pseudomonas edaphica]TLG90285.1 restriction endonuclease subunit S [Pseudomonas edaphica]